MELTKINKDQRQILVSINECLDRCSLIQLYLAEQLITYQLAKYLLTIY